MGVTLTGKGLKEYCEKLQEFNLDNITMYNSTPRKGKYSNYSIVYPQGTLGPGISPIEVSAFLAFTESLSEDSFMGAVTATAYMNVSVAYTAVSNPPPPPPPGGGG